MNRISYASRVGLVAMAVAMALSGALRWLPDQAGRPGDYGPAVTVAERGDTDLVEAAERPARRVRASSAMPYFSFAQSLRPRG